MTEEAEMPTHMKRHFALMEESDVEGTDELREELERLWADPDEFENPDSHALLDSFEENSFMYVLHLGVLFGTDYEEAYPTGRNDEWPVPLSERER